MWLLGPLRVLPSVSWKTLHRPQQSNHVNWLHVTSQIPALCSVSGSLGVDLSMSLSGVRDITIPAQNAWPACLGPYDGY